MAGDDSSPPFRLMNFVSQEELSEARRTRGARVDDGTAQRDRPLYEILKENKDKKDAEFNERFKHRPPKALDEDETEFLEKLEMSRREYERHMADEEAQQLRSFQAAVSAQSTIVHELKDTPPVPKVQEQKLVGRKNMPARPLGMIIKVKPQAKKAKMDLETSEESLDVVKTANVYAEKSLDLVRTPNGDVDAANVVASTGLVSYSDESEEDD
uniref:FAM192A/Fyv6 N-terminal domain-containing protein n=1 Tax=Davidia involucrata TaxID=16924 RepID=A0A5B7BVX9_DAVIN